VAHADRSLTNLARRSAAQLLRLIPGSAALRLKRDLRDSAWLSDADAVIVSYPKSGRTFVRAMLACLFQRRFGIDQRSLLEFSALRRASPDVPRVLFSHAGDAMRAPDEITVDPRVYAGKKLVLIARHPGDIAISRYHHLKHRSRDRARRRLADQPLDSFVWAAEGGIPSIVSFLNQFAAVPGVIIIRYEDFLSDPTGALQRLVNAIGLEANSDDIACAVEFASLPNLKRREREGYFTSPRLRRARDRDERSGKVRAGVSGGYRAQLDPATAARIDDYVAEKLNPKFGYSGAA
jgi:Sulfotransferase domain